ncbi:hypothetical protein HU200_004081 [Digitaria exilis]|uniref:Uncharacterized protein n=1 Tax=Digitaria exilis TaxID=1010633 RepID=A0A835FWL4_9POAL|nr:hypothetical protein HU200_004081 [Digitaria exilis]
MATMVSKFVSPLMIAVEVFMLLLPSGSARMLGGEAASGEHSVGLLQRLGSRTSCGSYGQAPCPPPHVP